MLISGHRVQLIPKPFMRNLIEETKTFLSHVFVKAKVPKWMYTAFVYYLIIQSSLSLTMAANKSIWEEENPTSTVVYVFSFGWRLSTIFTEIKYANINFYLIVGLYTLANLPYFGFQALYKKNGSLTMGQCKVISFMHKIFILIVGSLIPSQIGSIIVGFINEKSSLSNVFLWIQLGIFIMFLIYHIVASDTNIFSFIPYNIGRSWAWSGTGQTTALIITYANLLLSRIAELSSGLPFHIVASSAAILSCFSAYYFITGFVLIDRSLLASWSGIFVASAAMNLALQVAVYTKFLDPTIIFLTSIIIAAVMMYVFTLVINRKEIKYTSLLDRLQSGDEEFEDVFPRVNSFLSTCRYGFIIAHPLVLSWEPFKRAAQCWPGEFSVWAQWFRFLIIYPEETSYMISIMDLCRQMSFTTLGQTAFLDEMQYIVDSRSRKCNPTQKRALKNIDAKVRNLKSHIVSFWTALDERSMNRVYDIASQINKQYTEITSNFKIMIDKTQNNAEICRKYANYLEKIVCNTSEAAIWIKKSQMLETTKDILWDTTKQDAMEVFQKIPFRIDREEIRKVEQYQDKNKDMNPIQSSSTYTAELENLDESVMNRRAQIYDMASEARFPMMRSMLFLAGILVVIGFFGGCFSLAFLTLKTASNVHTQADLMESVSSIALRYITVIYRIVVEGMVKDGTALDSATELAGIKAGQNDLNATKLVLENELMIEDITIKIDSILSSRRGIGSAVNDFLLTTKNTGKILIDNSGTLEIQEYNITLTEAMSGYSGYFRSFDATSTTISKEPYFKYLVLNIDALTSLLVEFDKLIVSDVESGIEEQRSNTLIATVIFIIATVALIPVSVFILLCVRSYWRSLSSALTCIQHVAINEAKERYMITQATDYNEVQELKVSNKINEMKKGRSSTGGIPVLPIGILFVLIDLVAIACILGCFFYIKTSASTINNIPYAALEATQAGISLGRISVAIRRLIAVSEGTPILIDRQDELTEYLSLETDIALVMIDNFMLGDGISFYGVISQSISNRNKMMEHNQEWKNATIAHDKYQMMSLWIGATYAKTAVIGRLSQSSTTFNLFSSDVNICCELCNAVSVGEFGMTEKFSNKMPNSMQNACTEKDLFVTSREKCVILDFDSV